MGEIQYKYIPYEFEKYICKSYEWISVSSITGQSFRKQEERLLNEFNSCILLWEECVSY